MAEEQVQETTSDSVPEKKKKGLIKILIIGLFVAIIAGGAGYYFYGRSLSNRSSNSESKPIEKKEVGPILALDPFIINVSGNTSRYVKISVAIELASEKAVEHTKKMTPVIRDTMLTVLGSKAPEVFMDVTGRNGMKKELYDGISGLFGAADLKSVYITDIIMQ